MHFYPRHSWRVKPYPRRILWVQSLQVWWKESVANHNMLTTFAHVLIVRLRACFPCNHSTLQLKKERMWGAYHRLRTADTFVNDWRVFLSDSVRLKAFPAFYQFVTHHIFKELIKEEYPVTESTKCDHESPGRPLTYEEQNALCYYLGTSFKKCKTWDDFPPKKKWNGVAADGVCRWRAWGDGWDRDMDEYGRLRGIVEHKQPDI